MPHHCFLQIDLTEQLAPVVRAFETEAAQLRSDEVRRVHEVRDFIRPHLIEAGWEVGQGVRSKTGISVQASHGPALRSDAVHRRHRAALWIETGRSWTNNGFLEHLIRATVCPEIDHLAIALRGWYNGRPAYEDCVGVLEPVIRAGRLGLPYRSLVLVSF